MNRAILILITMTISACTPETRTTTTDLGSLANDRDQFRVVRQGIDMDERAIACANDPKSVGFNTSQECFADAQRLMNGG